MLPTNTPLLSFQKKFSDSDSTGYDGSGDWSGEGCSDGGFSADGGGCGDGGD